MLIAKKKIIIIVKFPRGQWVKKRSNNNEYIFIPPVSTSEHVEGLCCIVLIN